MPIQINDVNVIDDSRNISAGIITANQFAGSGDKLIFSPTVTTFSPIDGATGVSALSSPDISITYNQPIIIGSGVTITLRKDSATGTIAESFTVGVSTRATLNNQTLTIDTTDNFDYDQEYYVVVPQGSVKNNVDGNSALLDTYNFTTEAGPVVTTVAPGFGATDVGISTNIVFTYDKNIRAGVGTITLRTVSAAGTITESYDVTSSGRLTFSTNTLTIDPTSNLERTTPGTNYYVVIPNNAVAGYAGTDTYNFTAETLPTSPGEAYEGGYAICLSGGTVWVVSPFAAEVSRNWYSRADSVTRAQAVSGCSGWFVPNFAQLQNPGFVCRDFWDQRTCGQFYWSNEDSSPTQGCMVYFGVSNNGGGLGDKGSAARCARAFRCVSY